jgi:uncharacterized protein with NRDE domain
MCLILFAYRAHPEYRLVIAANRDEWFRRPTAAAGFWADAPEIFAGRDLEQRGTWLGVTTTGRFAAITNFRDPANQRPDAPSRGHLVSDFLRARVTPAAYLERLRPDAGAYNGFSLLVADGASLCFFSNREGAIRSLAPGVYGLSNDLLDVPWPKVRTGKDRLARELEGRLDADALLALLDDTGTAPDAELPRTGVGIEWERKLSAARTLTDGYGTRSSTTVLVGVDDGVEFLERSFDERGAPGALVRQRFTITRAPAPSSRAGSPPP